MASWLEHRDKYERIAKRIDPAIRLYGKQSSPLMRAYSKIPGMGKEFLEQTATAIGPLHWYPENWSDIEKDLYHEGRHTWQKRWLFGLGIHPWVGLIPFAIVAVFVLPVFLTVRFWLELDAESFALTRKHQTGSAPAYIFNEMKEFAEKLSSGDYIWAWRRKWALRIARRRAQRIVHGSR